MFTGGGFDEQPDGAPRELLDLASIDLGALSKAELHDLVLASEERARLAKADLYELCAEVKRRNAPSFDRYRNDTLWLADSLRIAKGKAGAVLKRGALLFDVHPELGAAFRAGVIRDEHLDLFARVWNRRELRPFLARDLESLLGFARNEWAMCRNLFAAWETLVDPVDPNEYAERAFDDRSAAFSDPVQQQVFIEILTTSAVFAVLEPALKVLTDEMFKADWAEAQSRVCDGATMDDLIRNDRQRLHDAIARLLFAGIGYDPSTANVVVNLTVDEETLREEAERRDAAAAGEEPPARDTSDAVRRAATRRCESESGRAISPADALDFAIAGHIRLFVMNTKTRDFTASAKTRLFTGDLRRGIMIPDRYCTGPGCDTRSWHCEADHVLRNADGGETTAGNGGPGCGPCHRHKTRLENLGLWPPPP